jgi:MerR family transcriptional regulator, light-induced transcriptional regulator
LPVPTRHPGYPIKIAALRSGLTPHLIRAWEKRYEAVRPDRSDTHRRLYSEEAIERLTLLGRVTRAGHSIGHVATCSDEQLRAMLHETPSATPPVPPTPPEETAEASSPQLPLALAACYEAVQAMDGSRLETELHRVLVSCGRTAVMEHVLVPLIHQIGVGWEMGTLRIAHEHVAGAVIRTILGNFVRAHSGTSNAPTLIVTTPAGQLHELGALLAGARAVDFGWRVLYLGPNLPAEEIAGAYLQSQADAVAISIVYPGDDPELGAQLRLLRRLLPPQTPIIAGGRAAAEYRPVLQESGIALCTDTSQFVAELRTIRRRRAESSR